MTEAPRPYTLRKVQPADLEIVLAHRAKMFHAMGLTATDESLVASREFFEAALNEDRYHGWFALDGGAVVAGGGIVLLAYQPGPNQHSIYRPFVVNMWTEEAHRGQGIARSLMETMIAWTREQGHSSLNLHASDAGRHLYETLGFKPTNEMRLVL